MHEQDASECKLYPHGSSLIHPNISPRTQTSAASQARLLSPCSASLRQPLIINGVLQIRTYSIWLHSKYYDT